MYIIRMKIVISPWNINSKWMNGWNNRWDPDYTLNLCCVSINMASWNSHNLPVMDCSKHPKHRTPESLCERLSVDPSRSTSRLSKIRCLSTFILEKKKKEVLSKLQTWKCNPRCSIFPFCKQTCRFVLIPPVFVRKSGRSKRKANRCTFKSFAVNRNACI